MAFKARFIEFCTVLCLAFSLLDVQFVFFIMATIHN